jgi:uncharacterized protein (TIGR03435 family)
MASCVLLAALSLGLAFGQTTEPPPVFEAADVHVSAPSTNQFPYMRGRLRPGRNDLLTATMVDLIRTAYGVDAQNVIGGPNWLELDRFDVIAKAPSAASPETLKLMLQALLADRFGLTTHKDNQPLPGFVLTQGKRKLQLKASDGPGKDGCNGQPPPARVPGTVPMQVVTCHNVSMATFAEQVRRMASAYINHTVVDQTGLEGTWDFTVRWTGRGQLADAGADGVTIFDAVEKLGLKLEPQNIPSPVIVLDHVNRKPVDNPPDVARLLPPADTPTEFEVADIKPSAPGSNPGQFRLQPGGRLDVRNMTAKFLITFAWDIAGDMAVGLPKSLESDRFDIIAKTSDSGVPGLGLSVESDTFRLMLRALLQDRFKLTTHTEVQTVSVYALVAPKKAAKLKKADESSRIRFEPCPERQPLLPIRLSLAGGASRT